jgi:hypothetical protein
MYDSKRWVIVINASSFCFFVYLLFGFGVGTVVTLIEQYYGPS